MYPLEYLLFPLTYLITELRYVVNSKNSSSDARDNTKKVVKTIYHFGSPSTFFEAAEILGKSMAPFGASDAVADIDILQGCEYSLKSCFIDFVLAIFEQLLPTAPLILLANNQRERESQGSSAANFGLYALDVIYTCFIVYPLLIASFLLRVITTPFVVLAHHGLNALHNMMTTSPSP